MTRWDAFISHASEDKETVAIPLAKALRRAGLRIWLGSVRTKSRATVFVRRSMKGSQRVLGIVILSPSFLAKVWPKRETERTPCIGKRRP